MNNVRRIDETGRRFSRLEVIALAGSGRWLCRCDCGAELRVRGSCLRSGNVKSCGCLHREKAREQQLELAKKAVKHGKYKTPEYSIWANIKNRCLNPKDNAFRHYGARGVTVCDRWNESFDTFYADMGPRPSPKHSIDRIDNDGNYSPENCRWATQIVQHNNKRNTRWVTYRGREITWANVHREFAPPDMPYSRFVNRMVLGWTVERALT